MRLILFIISYIVFIGQCKAASIAIIIDDIGYRQTDKAVLSLPQDVTLSVLPHTPLGQKLAQQGFNNGYEIMLHLPMQALDGRDLGPGGMTNDMNEQQIKQAIHSAVTHIPFAKGANNHMGSFLTQLEQPMSWVMESLKEKDLYFVDSVTTRFSKAGQQAQKQGVPLLHRQVFLDNDVSTEALTRQFQQAIALAKDAGELIIIAHPYPETVAFLNEQVKHLPSYGVKLVQTSALLKQPDSGVQQVATQVNLQPVLE